MRTATKASLALAVLIYSATFPALAYVGPGAGISLLGALWGVIVAVVLAVGMVLFWPLRIMLRKRKAAKAAAESAGEASTAGASSADNRQAPADADQTPG